MRPRPGPGTLASLEQIVFEVLRPCVFLVGLRPCVPLGFWVLRGLKSIDAKRLHSRWQLDCLTRYAMFASRKMRCLNATKLVSWLRLMPG